MKKLILLSLSIATALGISMSAAERQPSDNNSAKDSAKKERTDSRKARGDRHGRHMAFANPFDGIELSDAQKEQLKDVFSKCDADGKNCANCTDKSGDDTKQAPKRLSPEQLKAQGAERLAKIKSILTPEQYNHYLENVAAANLAVHKMKPGADKGKRPAGRPDKAPKNETQN